LEKYKQIDQSVVILNNDLGQKRLIAYYVSHEECNVSERKILSYMQKQLPDYMIPSVFIALETLPLTSIGKVNRKALFGLKNNKLKREKDCKLARNQIEFQLQRIWEALLGREKIGMKDDFFALGGHSLLAVHLISKVNKTFNVHYPVSWAFMQNTIEKQANKIRHQNTRVMYEPLLTFNEGGSKTPLFLIHPGHGGAEAYIELANLFKKDQPLYAVESQDIYSKEPSSKNIETLAAKYVQHIQAVRPQGPYCLGGWSLGGLIAYEVAQQLSAQNQTVQTIYLLDTFLLSGEERKQHLLVSQVINELLKKNPSHLQLPLRYRKRIEKVGKLQAQMMAKYKTDPYPGRVFLFKAKRKWAISEVFAFDQNALLQNYMDTMFLKGNNGWTQCVAHLEVQLIDGDHQSIMKGKNLRQISTLLQEDIAKYSSLTYRESHCELG